MIMDDKTLIQELRRLECRDNLQCLGCGYEHRCSTHGCAIIKQAVERLERLTAPEPNDPLTLEKLREMDGEPVWLVTSADRAQWAFVIIGHEEFISFNCADGTEWEFDLYGDNDGVIWTAYRRKPEEGTK